jgi:hypothetical protein
MTIPDPAVYASIPTALCFGVWSVRQLIKSVKGETGARGPRGIEGSAMTVRDYKQLADLLKEELNGRYMMAPEARDKFEDVKERVDNLDRKMDVFSADLSRLIVRIEPLVAKHHA